MVDQIKEDASRNGSMNTSHNPLVSNHGILLCNSLRHPVTAAHSKGWVTAGQVSGSTGYADQGDFEAVIYEHELTYSGGVRLIVPNVHHPPKVGRERTFPIFREV